MDQLDDQVSTYRAFGRGYDMPKFPNIHVQVSDGAPINVIIERAEKAMRKDGVSLKMIRQFRECVPFQYALAIEFIREWVSTD